ncbi:MAG: LamG domain-containing protein [bacterium]|nr:LamG domain-containing protein [bacterium]
MKKVLVVIALLCLMVADVYAGGVLRLGKVSSSPINYANEGVIYVKEDGGASFDSYTKLLLHCDGTDQSTTFTDSATSKTVTANGNAQIDTASYKFSTAAGLFDGNGDYLSLADSDDWSFGTGDFTIDFWIKFNSASGNQGLFQQYADSSNRTVLSFESNLLRFSICDGGSYTCHYYGSWSPTAGTWYHLALVRSSSNVYIFINGSALNLTTSIAINTVPNIAGCFEFGRGYFNSTQNYFNGALDEVRISKGIARWTSNFTAPSEAYAPTAATTSLYYMDPEGNEFKLN